LVSVQLNSAVDDVKLSTTKSATVSQAGGAAQLKVASITDPSPLPSSQSQVGSAFVQTEISPVVDVTDTPV